MSGRSSSRSSSRSSARSGAAAAKRSSQEPAQRNTSRLSGFAPIIAPGAKLLILGSFPSEASLAAGQYYAHPRNQFWRLLGALVGVPLATLPYASRLDHVRQAGIAIWDVHASCVRPGSLDSAIRAALANPFAELLRQAPAIGAVAFNGATAARQQAWFDALGLRTYRLPSTSPAHASLDFAQKLARWQILADDGWIARVAQFLPQ